jgi:hypothetical protein
MLSPSSSLGRAAAAVLPALEQAARRTGVDFDALFHTARLESGFDPLARARTSSATGLFQFIDSTWLSTLARHGPRHGIAPSSRTEALSLRTDPEVAALMAAEHMADNAASLERATGRKPDATALYLAHFLGVGGAAKFLGALDQAPDTPGIQLFPSAARANRAIFLDRTGAPRSLADIRDLFARKLGQSAVPSRSPSSTGTVLPDSGTAPGTDVPAALLPADPPTVLALLQRGFTGGAPPSPRLAAQAARLLLAELGA